MMTNLLHPALLYYGNTREQVFPVVLVIGREPNADSAMGSHAGAYNFREYPYAGIWNIAYSLMAEEIGLKGQRLKRICERARSSPFLFGNALPLGITNAVPNKLPQRLAVQNEARQHIQNVFSFEDLISRVRLVLLSGLHGTEFSKSCEAIAEQCQRWNLPSVSLPFFRGPNKVRIKQQLALVDRSRMSEVGSAFLEIQPKGKG